MLIKSRDRFAALLAILATVSIMIVVVSNCQLYQVALREERSRLRVLVQSQARFAEAVARFDSQNTKDTPEQFPEVTISQMRDAHERFDGFGRTGEFVIGRRVGDNVVFLLRHAGTRINGLSKMPLLDSRAEPMRRAVSGQSGTIVARDYRGRRVLAAYEPIDLLNLGLVAKIDLDEVRRPFVRAGILSGVFAIFLVVSGGFAIIRVARPWVRADEEVTRQHLLLSNILDNVPHFVFWKNTDLVYMGCNGAFARAAGVKRPARVVGKTDFDLAWPAEQAESYRRCDRQVLETDQPLLDVEERLIRADGVATTILTSKVPLHDGQDRTIGVLGVCADITQLKAAEDALRDKDEQLRHKQKLEAIGDLAGGIAHEFNNLLQAIRGFATLAMNELPDHAQPHQDLRQVVAAADRATSLTRQLLNFGRCQSLTKEPVDANRLVRDTIKMIRPILGEHIEVKLKLDEDAGTVCVDPNAFQQALMNLCINARDAMPSGGQLILRTDNILIDERYTDAHVDVEPGQYVRFSVTDTGCGISADVRQRVFEPFFTTKEVGKGTGLGLSMVYGTVKQHGGAIHLYSEPGAGTTFKLYLPLAIASNTRHTQSENMPVLGGDETILLAEDDPSVQDVAVRILKAAGYRILRANDGEAAVRMVEEHGESISLALLDVVMPKMNGREMYQQIERLAPGIKVVFCTGYDPAADPAGFIEQYGLRLVEKPFATDNLLRTIREVLDADHDVLADVLAPGAGLREEMCVG